MPEYVNYVDYIFACLGSLKPDIQITEETDLVAEAGLSSLQVMELIEQIEDHFDVSIPLNILADVNTVGDLARQIERLDK